MYPSLGTPALDSKLAEWFLGVIEKMFNQNLSFNSSFYVRYVDSVFAIFHSSKNVQSFLNALSNLHTHVRFTCKEATGLLLSFLMLKYRFATKNLMSVCTANQILPVYIYILPAQRVCPGNEALSFVCCIVLISIHPTTHSHSCNE